MHNVKPVNEVYARHRLNICQQNPGESLEDFLERLKFLSVDCNHTDSTSAQIKEAAIRDAFISRLQSGHIRQRILEVNVLRLNDVFDRARRLEDARRNASSYEIVQSRRLAENTAALRANKDEKLTEEEKSTNAESCSVLKQASCFFCGGIHLLQMWAKRPLCQNVSFNSTRNISVCNSGS